MADLIDRQAAIDAVLHHGEIENNYTDLYYDGYCDGVYDSADMLKDLPSAQPTQKNYSNTLDALDCISRQAAIDAIVNTISEIGYHDNSEVARYGATFRQHEIIDIIENLPTAEPKKGRWTKISPAGIYECSQCGQNVMTGDIEVYAYCHHCGAKMKEENDE